MRARRVDGNLTAIVEVARGVGFLVNITNADWDLTVQMGMLTELWECKNGKGRVTPTQKKLKSAGWNIFVVRTADDVLKRRAALVAQVPF